RDLLLAGDVENPLGRQPAWRESSPVVQKDHDLELRSELCWIRFDAKGGLRQVALCRGSRLKAGTMTLELRPGSEFAELRLNGGRPELVSGDRAQVVDVLHDGRSV